MNLPGRWKAPSPASDFISNQWGLELIPFIYLEIPAHVAEFSRIQARCRSAWFPRSTRRARPRPRWNRRNEEHVVELCARGDYRPSRWLRAGDPQVLAEVAAMHFYTGERFSNDIDAKILARVMLDPQGLQVAYRGEDGHARLLYFDTQYNDSYALLHDRFSGQGQDDIRAGPRGIDRRDRASPPCRVGAAGLCREPRPDQRLDRGRLPSRQ